MNRNTSDLHLLTSDRNFFFFSSPDPRRGRCDRRQGGAAVPHRAGRRRLPRPLVPPRGREAALQVREAEGLKHTVTGIIKGVIRNGTLVTLKWKYFTNLFKCIANWTNQIASFAQPMKFFEIIYSRTVSTFAGATLRRTGSTGRPRSPSAAAPSSGSAQTPPSSSSTTSGER